MSRSFGKSSKGDPMWRGWHRSMRVRERLIIHQIMSSEDYDDVIFPLVGEVSDPWCCDNYSNALVFKKEIRDEYFLEIRNILNGFSDRYVMPSDETFIEAYQIIKGLIPYDGWSFCFEWLNLKAVKKAVKSWKGEPLDVLKYLTDKGFIEQAVVSECKKRTAK